MALTREQQQALEEQRREMQESINRESFRLAHEQGVGNMPALNSSSLFKERKLRKTEPQAKKQEDTKTIANNPSLLFASKEDAYVSHKKGKRLILESEEADDQRYHSNYSLHAQLA
jgi:hypothetical protein